MTAVIAAVVAAAIGVSACSSNKDSAKKVSLIGFSVPKPAYDALETAFKATPQGKGIEFSASYGASGTQSKAVASGQPADYVTFSLEPDITKLVPNFVNSDWNAGSTKGIVSSSVVVIAVRKGNPKHITGWDDLIKPGIKIVTPDPASSGSAKWNILAAYTHVLANGGTEEQAQTYLRAFFKNVVSKPSSGSLATEAFTSGTGDVLLSYENEAIAARQKGAAIDYLVPAESFLIQNPGGVTKNAPQAAKDFLAFVLSEQGQKIFASKGFRPVDGISPGVIQGANDPNNPFPTVAKLTTIDDLGGWSVVNKKYFDPDNGIVTKIEEEVG